MTVALTPTMIVLGTDAADSNVRTGTALPINLSHRECRPFQPSRWPQSRRTDLKRRPRAQTNRPLSQPPIQPRPSLGNYPHSA